MVDCVEAGRLAAMRGFAATGSCREPPTLLWGVVNESENGKAGFVTFIRFLIRATTGVSLLLMLWWLGLGWMVRRRVAGWFAALRSLAASWVL